MQKLDVTLQKLTKKTVIKGSDSTLGNKDKPTTEKCLQKFAERSAEKKAEKAAEKISEIYQGKLPLALPGLRKILPESENRNAKSTSYSPYSQFCKTSLPSGLTDMSFSIPGISPLPSSSGSSYSRPLIVSSPVGQVGLEHIRRPFNETQQEENPHKKVEADKRKKEITNYPSGSIYKEPPEDRWDDIIRHYYASDKDDNPFFKDPAGPSNSTKCFLRLDADCEPFSPPLGSTSGQIAKRPIQKDTERKMAQNDSIEGNGEMPCAPVEPGKEKAEADVKRQKEEKEAEAKQQKAQEETEAKWQQEVENKRHKAKLQLQAERRKFEAKAAATQLRAMQDAALRGQAIEVIRQKSREAITDQQQQLEPLKKALRNNGSADDLKAQVRQGSSASEGVLDSLSLKEGEKDEAAKSHLKKMEYYESVAKWRNSYVEAEAKGRQQKAEAQAQARQRSQPAKAWENQIPLYTEEEIDRFHHSLTTDAQAAAATEQQRRLTEVVERERHQAEMVAGQRHHEKAVARQRQQLAQAAAKQRQSLAELDKKMNQAAQQKTARAEGGEKVEEVSKPLQRMRTSEQMMQQVATDMAAEAVAATEEAEWDRVELSDDEFLDAEVEKDFEEATIHSQM